jgi:adenosine kinase
MPQVTYIPGGSIQNTLRVTALCLNMEPNKANMFKLTMLGATGNDNYRNKIIYAFDQLGVQHILEIIPNVQTSRCGVGIHQKERCLLPEIRASNCITEKFIKDNEDKIFKHDALLIEGYFLQEKYDLCTMLCDKFKNQRKLVILTLSAVTIVIQQNEKIIEISNYADIIVGNMAELEALAGTNNMDYKTTFEKASRKLRNMKDRLFVITNGNRGVVVGKYDYTKGSMDFIFQCFPTVMKMEDIVDLNGAGDAFLGGFLSQYMQGKSLEACCKAGNDAASIILKNIGCTFPKNAKIQFKE